VGLSSLGGVDLEGRGEIPGQEFVDPADGVVGDLRQDRAEIEFRIEPVQFR